MNAQLFEQPKIELNVKRINPPQKGFVLSNGISKIGELLFLGASNRTAEIISDHENWIIKRNGTWNPSLSVRKQKEENDFENIPLNSEWIFPFNFGDERYFFININYWKGVWGWVDAEKNSLIEYYGNLSLNAYDKILVRNDLLAKIDIPKLILTGIFLLKNIGEDYARADSAIPSIC
jgi:hypothetical protein